ncbi:MAG: DNA/RNA non-specific endonuclease [candidate division Zixibacteria bacterium]|nr:DNA/RNA non-specific endonuclease [candidate division Zixibacteria bacterium]MDH3938548.1 DNA/RNA non-specific endonuclease [candidate division Zixibacteria bacterium]MDH4034814.1 DNA/RNA non-specific endonuclease [candidate division Zixibacteria bacterium]
MLSFHHGRVCQPPAVALGLALMAILNFDFGCSRLATNETESNGLVDTAGPVSEHEGTVGEGAGVPPSFWTYTDSLYDGCNIEWGIICDSGTFLDKEFFCLNHNDEWKIPYWVGYYLSDSNLQGDCDNSYSWKPDTALPEWAQAKDDDYKYTGFDRGHMAPAGCFERSVAARKATYVLSNACPQTRYLNRGRWRVLEEEIRQHVGIMGEAWVFTGTLFLDTSGFNDGMPPDTIGNGVGVPSHCFKAILSRKGAEYCAYAFVMPNTTGPLEGPSTNYMMSVDELEAITHYDFFYRLEDEHEHLLESYADPGWPDDCATWVPL